MDLKAQISSLVTKNKERSKLNKEETKRVVDLLQSGTLDNDITMEYVINVLMDLNPGALKVYVSEVFVRLEDTLKQEFLEQFFKAEKIKNNPNNFGVKRSIVIILELLKYPERMDTHLHDLLKIAAKQANFEGKGQKAAEILANDLLKKDDRAQSLFQLDYSSWDEKELKKLYYWVSEAVDREGIAPAVKMVFKDFCDKYNLLDERSTVVTDGIISISSSITMKDKDVSKSSERDQQMLGSGTKNEEAQTKSVLQNEHLASRTKMKQLMSELSNGIDQLLNEKYALSVKLSEEKVALERCQDINIRLEKQISELKEEKAELKKAEREKEQALAKTQKQIEELEERLAYAYKADQLAINQELVSFKNELGILLQRDYDNLQRLIAMESRDYKQDFDDLLKIINRMFNSLARKGIMMKETGER